MHLCYKWHIFPLASSGKHLQSLCMCTIVSWTQNLHYCVLYQIVFNWKEDGLFKLWQVRIRTICSAYEWLGINNWFPQTLSATIIKTNQQHFELQKHHFPWIHSIYILHQIIFISVACPWCIELLHYKGCYFRWTFIWKKLKWHHFCLQNYYCVGFCAGVNKST